MAARASYGAGTLRAAPGSYRRDGWLARFGADIALPDVLMELAACERRRDFSRPCGALFPDLAVRSA
jgi:hypothetical protein